MNAGPPSAPVPVGTDRSRVLGVSPASVAPVGRRVLAFVLDVLVVSVVVAVAAQAAAAISGSGSSATRLTSVVAALAVWAAQTVAEATTGATVGGASVHIRTVSARTGRPAGLLAILLRQLVVGVGWFACVLGAFVVVASGAWDSGPTLRGWHDKLAGTLVLRATALRPGVQPPAGPGAGPAEPREPVGVPYPLPGVSTGVGAAGSGAAPSPAPGADPVPGRVRPPRVVAAAEPLRTGPMAAPGQPSTGATGAAPPSVLPAMPRPVPPRVMPPAADTAARVSAPVEPAAPSPDGALVDVPVDLRSGGPATRRALREADRDVQQSRAGGDAASVPGADETPAGGPAGTQVLPAWSAALPRVPGVPAGTPRSESDDVLPPVVPSGPVPGALDELELTRLRTPPEGQPVAGPARPIVETGVRLVFDTGERVDVVGDGVVGRSPDARPALAHVIAIDDPERSVSKVHLLFGPQPGAGGGLWVLDRGSTNGTLLVAPDGARAVLAPGVRAEVTIGWTIRFGEREVRVEHR